MTCHESRTDISENVDIITSEGAQKSEVILTRKDEVRYNYL